MTRQQTKSRLNNPYFVHTTFPEMTSRHTLRGTEKSNCNELPKHSMKVEHSPSSHRKDLDLGIEQPIKHITHPRSTIQSNTNTDSHSSKQHNSGRAELLSSTPSLEEIERDSPDESFDVSLNNGFTDEQFIEYEILQKKFGKSTRRIDHYKIYPKDHEKDPVKIDYIKNVDWTKQHQQRAGVIVYREIDDKLVFCLGADTNSDDLTDFGGGVKTRDFNPIRGGLREFLEETLGVFGSFKEDQVQNCLVVYSEVMLIMFLHLDFNIDTTTSIFENRLRNARYPEIKKLVWMSKFQFFLAIDERNEHNTLSPTNNSALTTSNVEFEGNVAPNEPISEYQRLYSQGFFNSVPTTGHIRGFMTASDIIYQRQIDIHNEWKITNSVSISDADINAVEPKSTHMKSDKYTKVCNREMYSRVQTLLDSAVTCYGDFTYRL